MSKSIVGILHQSTLKIFVLEGKDKFEEITLNFPEAVVKKSDIFDLDKFSYDVKNQLIKRPDLKGSEILFLIPSEKIFSKKIKVTTGTLEEEKARFFTQIPITEEESYLNIYQNDQFVTLVAVPKKLVANLDLSVSKIGFHPRFLPLPEVLGLGFGTKSLQLVGFTLDNHFNLVSVHGNQFLTSDEVDWEKPQYAEVLNHIQELKKDPDFDSLVGLILLEENPTLQSLLEQNGIKVGLIQAADNIYGALFKIINETRGNVGKYLINTSVDAKPGAVGRRAPKIYFPWRKILSMVGIFLFLAFLIGVFYFAKEFGSRSQTSTPSVNQPSPSVTPVASNSAVPTASESASVIGKADLKVRVLNGNGVSGDAGRLERKIEGLGYTNAESDTADQQGQRITAIKYSVRVTNDYRAEINKAITDEYVQIREEDGPAAGIDIEITTGTRK